MMIFMMDMDRTACYRAISTRDARFDGRLFVGVKTTGIYCRPICPARTPKFENTSFYPSAAAAQEAGSRPCLRCRPDTAPDLAFWRGTSNPVSRALALIEAGGLDEADVEGLANRLGVGARQLRRLFRQHVGASPIAVAQTRRILLAKQLIHESSLPMAEVALASSFNSVRRFNETFLAMFGRSPIKLRRIRDKAKREAGALSVRLPYRPPYDWAAMLSVLAARAILGQQITVPAATKLLGRLVAAHGAPLPATIRDGEGLGYLFPSPARVAKAEVAALGMPNARAMAVKSLAQAMAADPAIFARGASLEEAIAKLRSLPGIGEWTAQYIAMRELREPDAFPAADIGLLLAMASADGRRPSPAQLLSRAERWRPWRAYAALHLWAAGAHPPHPENQRGGQEAGAGLDNFSPSGGKTGAHRRSWSSPPS